MYLLFAQNYIIPVDFFPLVNFLDTAKFAYDEKIFL